MTEEMNTNILELDLGDEQPNLLPLCNRPSVAILLGAGFSAPRGYPVGKIMNERLLHFDDTKISFSPCGKLVTSLDGQKPELQTYGYRNIHEKYFVFCKRLIKGYTEAHNNEFDYELFYDFIKSNEVREERYQQLCDDLLDGSENYDNYLFGIIHIYNQMILHLLEDRDGKCYYDDEPSRINGVDDYNRFLSYLSQLSKEYIIDVHTLNHDLLFESFENTSSINGYMSDGFDEYGSEYYGKLVHDNRNYLCRLARYTGRYNTPIRLYKLHGSIDYVPFYRRNKNGIMVPDKYVKTRWGIWPSEIIKSKKSKLGYDESPFPYHIDFLTGSTSKIIRYNEPLLFKKLFKKFKNNLLKTSRLIIIGYGCKDAEVNDMIKTYFDYNNKPSFIIDPYASKDVKDFAHDINAKVIKESIEQLDKNWFA